MDMVLGVIWRPAISPLHIAAGAAVLAAIAVICYARSFRSGRWASLGLLAMRLAKHHAAVAEPSLLKGLTQGLRYAFGHGAIRAILLLLMLLSILGMPYAILLPVFARDVLHGGGQNVYYSLVAATGVGAVCGAIFLASRKSVAGLEKFIAGGPALFGTCLVVFSFSRTPWISIPVLTVTGFGLMVQMASCNTMLQTIVDDKMRGRVMSLYTVAFLGLSPFGCLLAGWMAHWIGAPHTVLIFGITCICAAIAFTLRLPAFMKQIRPRIK